MESNEEIGYLPKEKTSEFISWYDQEINTDYEIDEFNDDFNFFAAFEINNVEYKSIMQKIKDLGGYSVDDFNMNFFDNKDDYYNAFYNENGQECEIVVRAFEDVFLGYIEDCSTGELILEKDFDTYDQMVRELADICIKYNIKFPTEDQLLKIKDNSYLSENFEICNECHDHDCIIETGGC